MDDKVLVMSWLAKQQHKWKLQVHMNVVMMNTSTEVTNFYLRLNYHLRFAPSALTKYWKKNTEKHQESVWKMLITQQSKQHLPVHFLAWHLFTSDGGNQIKSGEPQDYV